MAPAVSTCTWLTEAPTLASGRVSCSLGCKNPAVVLLELACPDIRVLEEITSGETENSKHVPLDAEEGRQHLGLHDFTLIC